MTSPQTEVLVWAQRIMSIKGSPPWKLLEIAESATMDQAQDAFHRVARTLHPDLHRHALTPEDMEMVTSAYACVAGAYADFRSLRESTQRMRPLKPGDLPAGNAAPAAKPAAGPRPTPSGPAPAAGGAQQMSSRALVYFRKAELALKRGDIRGALLQLKMAIAADPQSGFLRTAMAEVELELNKG